MELTTTERMTETSSVVDKKILGIRATRLDKRSQKPSFTTVGAAAWDIRFPSLVEAPETLLGDPESRLGATEPDSPIAALERESLVIDNLDVRFGGGVTSSLSESDPISEPRHPSGSTLSRLLGRSVLSFLGMVLFRMLALKGIF